jgi:hypothetical protein
MAKKGTAKVTKTKTIYQVFPAFLRTEPGPPIPFPYP